MDKDETLKRWAALKPGQNPLANAAESGEQFPYALLTDAIERAEHG